MRRMHCIGRSKLAANMEIFRCGSNGQGISTPKCLLKCSIVMLKKTKNQVLVFTKNISVNCIGFDRKEID
jgi:hypothetical protein